MNHSSSELRTDIKKCIDLLRKVWRDKKTVLAWDIEKDHLKSFELTIKEISDRNQKIVLVPSDESADWDGIQKIVRGSGILNFYLPSESVVFRSELLNLEHDYLVVRYPNRWMFEERRRHERYESIGNVQLYFSVGKKRVKPFSVFDLSKTGLSIILPRGEGHNFSQGESIEKAVLVLDGEKIPLALEVKNILGLKPYELEKLPYAGKKVGLRFTSDVQEVADFIDGLKEEVNVKNKGL